MQATLGVELGPGLRSVRPPFGSAKRSDGNYSFRQNARGTCSPHRSVIL
ncbi:DUF3761 domain-containing protein [Granulicella tundricola]